MHREESRVTLKLWFVRLCLGLPPRQQYRYLQSMGRKISNFPVLPCSDKSVRWLVLTRARLKRLGEGPRPRESITHASSEGGAQRLADPDFRRASNKGFRASKRPKRPATS